MKLNFTLLFALLSFATVIAQEGNYILPNSPIPQLNPIHTEEEIRLDGILDEDFWIRSKNLESFTQYFPTDTIPAEGSTEIKIAYSDDAIYVAAICHAGSNDFLVESMKRDYGFMSNDNISFLFDTYNDKTNAFLFGMNPYGARREALISNGGKARSAFDESWDNKWDGQSKRYDTYWICEMAIPLSSIRYKDDSDKWRFNAYRNDNQKNEITTFINIPREYILMDLNYMADLNWKTPLAKPKQNISIIPYATAGLTRDYEDDSQNNGNFTYNAGADAKIAVTSSLNLDLTVNPDFSQVEIDQQVQNLGRFEIFLPEKRQFFLENADLFSSFGNRFGNPFFSRRIGVSIDTVTENNIQNTIYGGMRITGKLNENLRVGLLSMQAAAQPENDLPSFNYSVAALEHKVFDRSNIALLFVNKQAANPANFDNTVDTYDRVAGLEYRLNSKNNYWSGKASFLKAMTPDEKEMKNASLARIDYNRRRFRLEFVSHMIGDGFDAEVGFVPRKDFLLFAPSVTYRIFPKDSKISRTSFTLRNRRFYKLGKDDSEIIEDFGLEEINYDFEWEMSFTNNHRAEFNIKHEDFVLLNDFDPTRVQEEGVEIKAGRSYANTNYSLSYGSNRRSSFFYRLEPFYGSFFGGYQAGVKGNINYNFIPFGSIGINYNYTHIDIGGDFEKADLWLVGPRVNVTFSTKLFWTTFVQYNNRLDNLNINTRLQWRFAPVSDFFLVYTDNYNTEIRSDIMSRNRAIVAKLTYWINL